MKAFIALAVGITLLAAIFIAVVPVPVHAACQPDNSQPCYTDPTNRKYTARGILLPDSDCWSTIYASLRPMDAYEFTPTPLLNKQTWVNNDKPDAGPSTPSKLSFNWIFDGSIVKKCKQTEIHFYVETKDPGGNIKVVNRFREFATAKLIYEFNEIKVYTNKGFCQ